MLFETVKEKEDFGKHERENFRSDLEEELWNCIKTVNYNDYIVNRNIDTVKNIANRMFISLRHELIPEVYYKKYENAEQTKVSLAFFTIGSFLSIILFLVYQKNYSSMELKLIVLGFYFLWSVFWITISYLFYYYKARKEYKKNDDESHLTSRGKEILEQIYGFRKFLLSVENEKLNKFLKEDPKYCEKMLPYAIALGVGNKWIKKCRSFSDKFNIETIPSEVTTSHGNFIESMMTSGAISDTEITSSSSGGGDRGSDSGFDSGGSSSGSSGGGGGGGGGGSR